MTGALLVDILTDWVLLFQLFVDALLALPFL
jgi:hypothetical protein